MRTRNLGPVTLTSCIAAALLAGCGGSQPPIGAPGAMPQTSAIATHARSGKSWMLPEAKSEDLLYVSTFYGVYVFKSPSGSLVGNLDVPGPGGLCSNRAGNIFVTAPGDYEAFEYAHGGASPIAAFSDNYIDFNPVDCSADPRRAM